MIWWARRGKKPTGVIKEKGKNQKIFCVQDQIKRETLRWEKSGGRREKRKNLIGERK